MQHSLSLQIPATDRGFRYGMSVFETIAIRRRTGLFVEEHLSRLRTASGEAGFLPPAGWGDELRRALGRPSIDEGVVRVYITAGDGAPTAPVTASRVVLLAEPMPLPVDPPPCSLKTLPFGRAPGIPAKSGNYWPNILAKQSAASSGCDDAILVNDAGHVAGASMANLFVVLSGRLLTPDLSSGARNGVIREWVMRRFAAEEGVLTLADLQHADACFLTNSRIGIQPVRQIDGRPLGDGLRTVRIRQTYREEIFDA